MAANWWEWPLSFALPALAILISYAVNGLYPFGDLNVAIDDMYIQYLGLFGWLSDLFHGQGSASYSFSQGMGGSPVALIAYYLSSPFSLGAAFVSNEDIGQLFNVIILLKIATAGFTAYLFLRLRYRPGVAMLALSSAYALCGFATCQSNNIMWLDGVYMLPVMALGVYELVHRERAWVLFVAVALATLFNWYSSYIDCLFCVAYFFALRVQLKGRSAGWLRDCLRFAACMVLGLLASMVLFLPATLELMQGVEGNLTLRRLISPRIPASAPALLSYFSTGTVQATSVDRVPCMYTHALALVAGIAWLCSGLFARKDTPRPAMRSRVALGLLFAFCLAGCVFAGPMTLWSVLRYADSFWFRHAFTVSFALVIMAAECVMWLRGIDARDRVRPLAISAIVLAVLIGGSFAVTASFTSALRTSTLSLVIEFVCLAASPALLLAALRLDDGMRVDDDGRAEARPYECEDTQSAAPAGAHARSRMLPTLAAVALVALAFADGAYNASCVFSRSLFGCAEYASYTSLLYKTYDAVRADAKQWRGSSEGLLVSQLGLTRAGGNRCFYGALSTEELTSGTQGMNEYTSAIRADTENFMQAVGYSNSNRNIFGYYANSPQHVVDTLIGVDYAIACDIVPGATLRGDLPFSGWRLLRYEDSLGFAYALAPAATGDVGVLANPDNGGLDMPFAVQEQLLASATGANTSDLFTPASVSYATGDEPGGLHRVMHVTPATSGVAYVYLPGITEFSWDQSCAWPATLIFEGRALQYLGGNFDQNVVCLGQLEAGKSYELVLDFWPDVPEDTSPECRAFFADPALSVEQMAHVEVLSDEVLAGCRAKLDAGMVSGLSVKNGAVDFDVDLQDARTMFVRIPFDDEGWTCTVDGKPAKLHEVYGAFTGVTVDAGMHHVALRYEIPGFKLGAMLSIAGIALFGAWRLIMLRRRRDCSSTRDSSTPGS